MPSQNNREQKQVTVIVGTLNQVKINAVKQAFHHQSSHTMVGKNVPSDVRSQPIGLDETKQGALNRMRRCFPSTSSINTTYAVGIENGMVPGKELNKLMFGHYSESHWYDVGICAMTVFKQNSQFTYVTYATPLQIPNDATGMLPPDHIDGIDKNLEKYSKTILPLLKEKKDLYQLFSNGKYSRESTLLSACIENLNHLNNIHCYQPSLANKPFDTVVTFGTFDLFHELHKRLIAHAASLGKQLIIYIYDKDYKEKAGKNIPLTDSVQDRIKNTTHYALQYHDNVIVKRMLHKHPEQLKRVLQTYTKHGKVAVFGGDDQFSEYAKVINICYQFKTPIIALARGETKNKLCSSDLREKQSYQRLSQIYNVNLDNISNYFWKQRIKDKNTAKNYLQKLKDLGLEKAEIWQYKPFSVLNKQITKPITTQNKIVFCLPGRTPCTLDRTKKILKTIQENLVPINMRASVNSFLGCYEQNAETTEDYISSLAQSPTYFFSDDAMIFTKLLLMPSVTHAIAITKQEGKWQVIIEKPFHKPSIDTLQKNLAKITLWTRSRGSVIALEMENAFHFCLSELGYSEKDIATVAKSIGVISISNLASLDTPRLFTTFSVTGMNDKKANKYISAFPDKVKQLHLSNENHSLHLLEENHCAMLASIPDKIIDAETDKMIEDKLRHYTPLYFSYRHDQDNFVPLFIRDVFKMMLMRDETFKLSNLFLQYDRLLSNPRYVSLACRVRA